ncbi:hypothetical protein FisN_25Lh116 [Fistulifera solaris]|uniref:ER membrane protein complex subunit 2 n=1 Tax=Fistulifera solaris TaxID=1519565 RepID=A0A1Z5J7R6_FISSO|nr:hypothetical protein FisN_25Lh116 [Fistulifera solaris]|eukprot:GAX10035.1 hypothetical protein FisN_25Lh116 [Fistulifera solaris]
MDTEADLETLVAQKDHVNVLRYLRVHQLRDPSLAVRHGQAALKQRSLNDVTRLAIYEQLALAALDLQDHTLADECLSKLREKGVEKDSVRFRLLLGRCLEASGDTAGASQLYDALLKENPANSVALKRKYCILKSQVGQEVATVAALNEYLQNNYSDPSAWSEMAKLRMEQGDFAKAIYAWEEVLLSAPTDPFVHVSIAECYTTVGGLDNLEQARKHFCQALELDASYRRAQFGLVVAANAYLEAASSASRKQQVDEFEVQVAKELVKFGAEQVIQTYNGTSMHAAVQCLMQEYTEDLK